MYFLDIIILFGAIQGLISSILLFRSVKGNITANRLLGFVILVLSLACLNLYLMQTGVRYQHPVVDLLADVVPLLIVMPVGPLLYFYAKTVLDQRFKLARKDRIHFYPAIIDLVPYLAALVWFIGYALNLFGQDAGPTFRNLIDQVNIYSDTLRWASITLYLMFAAKLLASSSGIDNSGHAWLTQLVVVFGVFQLLWLMHLVPYLIPSMRDELLALVDWYPIYVPLAVLVYWLGINGYLRNHETYHILPAQRAPETSALPLDLAERIKALLLEAMEKDKIFLDPSCNLEAVAKHTGIQPKMISSVVNKHIRKSFNEFVNEYRVNELKDRLRKGEAEKRTILGLALACGFNSQATMQRSFKQITGQSPREYQQAQRHANSPETSEKNTQIRI